MPLEVDRERAQSSHRLSRPRPEADIEGNAADCREGLDGRPIPIRRNAALGLDGNVRRIFTEDQKQVAPMFGPPTRLALEHCQLPRPVRGDGRRRRAFPRGPGVHALVRRAAGRSERRLFPKRGPVAEGDPGPRRHDSQAPTARVTIPAKIAAAPIHWTRLRRSFSSTTAQATVTALNRPLTVPRTASEWPVTIPKL